ncbi:hypothetical protein PR202_gb16047 [Eleusine coracana subsp. coracana]|uniref:DOG1 domain-containing protein n=1 Tax=Eleusine coracana subsp. coracana TaxID=191504 RepID=A0AAV5F0R6_ELECO|nr:hypothetical protein PR202_gb16047 [Eleusine coracana subsp. coracana]
MFDGEDFSYWKSWTKAYLLSQGRALGEIIEQEYAVPQDLNTTSADELVRYENNSKAVNILLSVLGRSEYDRVAHLDTAHAMWVKLCTYHDGTNQVKSIFRQGRTSSEEEVEKPRVKRKDDFTGLCFMSKNDHDTDSGSDSDTSEVPPTLDDLSSGLDHLRDVLLLQDDKLRSAVCAPENPSEKKIESDLARVKERASRSTYNLGLGFERCDKESENILYCRGFSFRSSGDQTHAMSGNGAMTFDLEYARWQEEQNKQINELRTAVNAHASDSDLRLIVDGIMAHYDEIFRQKGAAAKADVFHILSGMWKTPAERESGCYLYLEWVSSAFAYTVVVHLQLLVNHLEPLTEQQTSGLSNLQQSSQQAEDALSQGMEALQQSLAETLAGSLGTPGSSGNVANYMGQMAMAMGKLGTLENFLRQVNFVFMFFFLLSVIGKRVTEATDDQLN